MTAHLHSTLVEGCYRCELSLDEIVHPCVPDAHDFSDFDRVLCACDTMHTYCLHCGECLEPCALDDDLPPIEYMSEEASAALLAKTDPDECTCGHGGLPRHFHLQGCPLSPRTRA